MNFYTFYLSDKTIITIIKCLPLYEDIHFIILEKLIHDLIKEDLFLPNFEDIRDEIDWDDIDSSFDKY